MWHKLLIRIRMRLKSSIIMTNQTALITGVNNGTGYEVAKLLAKDGLRLIVVSGREDCLQQAAKEFLGLGAREVIIIHKDLSCPGASTDIYSYTKKHQIKVDLLINDSGLEEFSSTCETDLKKKLILIQLNIASMVYLYLNDMLPENKGRILQLASVALHQPALYLTAYKESKAFVLSFTNALINDVKNKNVSVAGVIPTQLTAGSKNISTTLNKQQLLNAKAGYDALMKGLSPFMPCGIESKVILGNALLN